MIGMIGERGQHFAMTRLPAEIAWNSIFGRAPAAEHHPTEFRQSCQRGGPQFWTKASKRRTSRLAEQPVTIGVYRAVVALRQIPHGGDPCGIYRNTLSHFESRALRGARFPSTNDWLHTHNGTTGEERP